MHRVFHGLLVVLAADFAAAHGHALADILGEPLAAPGQQKGIQRSLGPVSYTHLKLIGLALSAAMLFSVLSVPAFAAAPEESADPALTDVYKRQCGRYARHPRSAGNESAGTDAPGYQRCSRGDEGPDGCRCTQGADSCLLYTSLTLP